MNLFRIVAVQFLQRDKITLLISKDESLLLRGEEGYRHIIAETPEHLEQIIYEEVKNIVARLADRKEVIDGGSSKVGVELGGSGGSGSDCVHSPAQHGLPDSPERGETEEEVER